MPGKHSHKHEASYAGQGPSRSRGPGLHSGLTGTVEMLLEHLSQVLARTVVSVGLLDSR